MKKTSHPNNPLLRKIKLKQIVNICAMAPYPTSAYCQEKPARYNLSVAEKNEKKYKNFGILTSYASL